MDPHYEPSPDGNVTSSYAIDPSLLLFSAPVVTHGLNKAVQAENVSNIVDKLHAMNQASYDARDRIQKCLLSDTTTQRQYQSYIRAYVDWWEHEQYEHVQAKRQTIPAFPIVPGKVALFLSIQFTALNMV
ncbi:hypothetical protein Clacol_006427 [Clathrus columnatus]|uniref:Uncharacterized protein n=1 Tax=Clathrus columnatus TaxID=1419009 RepID=A0AAV5AI75_9AGAM|nr:hypothetical protein Clacol_006427 [Clathrus columnatus]